MAAATPNAVISAVELTYNAYIFLRVVCFAGIVVLARVLQHLELDLNVFPSITSLLKLIDTRLCEWHWRCVKATSQWNAANGPPRRC